MQLIVRPTVSVVMPAYNAAKYLREAIDSILAQTYTDFEFIIINDGSTDDTRAIIQSYDDPRIVYLENETNSGICVTLNKGLDSARGRYIARMDADDISLPERLAAQVAYMDTHPDIAVCGTDIEVFYNNTEPTEVFNFDTHPKTCKANLIFSATLAHPTAFIRTSVLNDFNLRYDDYYRGMEDHHLWWQIAKHSEISNIPVVLLRYRQHSAQVTKQTVNEEFRSRLRTFIIKRTFDCNVVLDTDELDAFCLYHEHIEAFDAKDLNCFISACHKILESLKKKKVRYYAAQKRVFSRAISFCLDKGSFTARDALKYQLLAFSKNTMDFVWLTKRMTHLHSLRNLNPVEKESQPHYRRIAVLMYYMKCGGVEAALINLLSKIICEENIVDLYLVEATGEFLGRIDPRVNIVDLSNILHPVQKELITSQNIHTTMQFVLKNGFLRRGLAAMLRYAFFKLSRYEFPAYKAARVSKKIADFDYDLVLDFHGYASFTTYFGANILSGKKKYTWCHSQNINFDHAHLTLEKYDRMFTVSSDMKSLPALRRISIPTDVFHNFIDTDKIIKDAEDGDTLPTTASGAVLLTIGRLSPPKGYDMAIEAAKILRDKDVNFKWYFCGDGEEKDKLTAMVREYALGDHIIFMGYQSNPYSYLASCDIYVQPSRREGYAVTLMEAKVLHKVIVTTKVSGSDEAVSHGYDGFVCNLDYTELASSLEKLIKDKQLLDKMTENARTNKFSQTASEVKLKSILSPV